MLLTPVLCFGALQVAGVKYEAKAMLVLLPPGASVPKAGNPYLNLGSMQPVVGVLSDSMLSQQTAHQVRDVSPTASYTVTPDPATSGAVLIIDVKDKTSAGAAKVMQLLAKMAPQQLNELQSAANTPPAGHISTDLVAQDLKPVASHKSQLRAGLLAAAAGIALSVLGAAFVDGYAGRRRRRRAVRPSRQRVTRAAAVQSDTDEIPAGESALSGLGAPHLSGRS
ncbi:hypothetical protein [Flexivirga alba]|uniref:Capsular polysaccharide biosynthesis protein n=1 Tax=Flexivirga alba TaxID=702742 RepID=A0ABW2AFX3_9MICO